MADVTAQGPRPSARRSRRTAKIAVLTGILVLALTAVLIAREVYFNPRDDLIDRTRIDAILVLGPPEPSRLRVAVRLADQSGGVPIYVSVHDSVDCNGTFICLHATPWTTKGEAGLLRDLMANHGVESPVVLTGTTHVPRARYVMHRCVNPDIPVIGADDELNLWRTIYEPIYQTAAFVKAVATDC